MLCLPFLMSPVAPFPIPAENCAPVVVHRARSCTRRDATKRTLGHRQPTPRVAEHRLPSCGTMPHRCTYLPIQPPPKPSVNAPPRGVGLDRDDWARWGWPRLGKATACRFTVPTGPDACMKAAPFPRHFAVSVSAPIPPSGAIGLGSHQGIQFELRFYG